MLFTVTYSQREARNTRKMAGQIDAAAAAAGARAAMVAAGLMDEEEVPRSMVPEPMVAHAMMPPHPEPVELPAMPTPLRHAHFDNPYRVLAMLEAGREAGKKSQAYEQEGGSISNPSNDDRRGVAYRGAAFADKEDPTTDGPMDSGPPVQEHLLARPALNSTAKLHSAQIALEEQGFTASARAANEAGSRARREATSKLNVPSGKSSRYADLTSVEPPPTPDVGVRVHEPTTFKSSRLEGRPEPPSLKDLWTRDREPEFVDTRRDASSDLKPEWLKPPEAVEGTTGAGLDQAHSRADFEDADYAAPSIFVQPLPLSAGMPLWQYAQGLSNRHEGKTYLPDLGLYI